MMEQIKTFHGKEIDFSKIPDITPDDVEFLSGIFDRFPRTVEGYHRFINTPPERRVPVALRILETQPRSGWVLRFPDLPQLFRQILNTHADEYYGPRFLVDEYGHPSTESVLEHCAEAQELFNKLYGHAPWGERQWGAECMKFHDIHEAIDGDFTPHCPITKAEKKRLEAISTNLLCEARHIGNLHTLHVYHCTQMFEGHAHDYKSLRDDMLSQINAQRASGKVAPHQQPAVDFFEKLYSQSNPALPELQARLADVDALHMAVRVCRMWKDQHIRPEQEEGTHEFWDYISKKITTPEAQCFFSALQEAYKDSTLSYQAALKQAFRTGNSSRTR